MRERQPGAAARGQPGGGAVRLRTRAETHRRKWRAGAGTAKTFAWRRQPGGQCKIRPRGGEAGGDGDGEGETLVRLAPPSLGSPGRLRRGRAARALRPIWDPTAPPPWPPRTSPHPSGACGERLRLAWRARVTSSCADRKPAVTVFREERCSWPSSALPPARTPSLLPGPWVPSLRPRTGAPGERPAPGVRARILVGSFFRFRAQEGAPLVF